MTGLGRVLDVEIDWEASPRLVRLREAVTGSGLALLVVMHKQILALSGFEFRLHDHKLLTALSFVNL